MSDNIETLRAKLLVVAPFMEARPVRGSDGASWIMQIAISHEQDGLETWIVWAQYYEIAPHHTSEHDCISHFLQWWVENKPLTPERYPFR